MIIPVPTFTWSDTGSSSFCPAVPVRKRPDPRRRRGATASNRATARWRSSSKPILLPAHRILCGGRKPSSTTTSSCSKSIPSTPFPILGKVRHPFLPFGTHPPGSFDHPVRFHQRFPLAVANPFTRFQLGSSPTEEQFQDRYSLDLFPIYR